MTLFNPYEEKTLKLDLEHLANAHQLEKKVGVPTELIIQRFMGLLEDAYDEQLALQQEQLDADYDDSMDGDAATALASAGWGTDEDYGGTDDRL